MSDLGRNLKQMRKTLKFNQTELAEMIGLSQTAIANYEANNRQPTIETLKLLSKVFGVSIDELVGNKPKSKGSNELKLEHDLLLSLLMDKLIEKDEKAFIEILKNSVYPFYSIENMIIELFQSIMYQIGDMWEKGTLSEADEHYATNLIRKVINYLSLKDGVSLKSQKAISLTVGSEQHTLGIEMVNIYLQSLGVDCLYLGSNLPIRSISKVIEDYEPEYIFISLTLRESMNGLIHLIEYIRDVYGDNIMIGVGGQGILSKRFFSKYRNITVFKDIKEIKKYI